MLLKMETLNGLFLQLLDSSALLTARRVLLKISLVDPLKSLFAIEIERNFRASVLATSVFRVPPLYR